MGYIGQKLEINTANIKYNGKVYCAYCKKEIKPDIGWDDFDQIIYHHCDCETALKEIEKVKELNKAKQEAGRIERELKEIRGTARYKLVTQERIILSK